MPPIRNLAGYSGGAHFIKGEFVYRGTTALKKGRGMCFDLNYLTTETGQTATDPYGARGLATVEVPDNTQNMSFAGVLTQDYPARNSGEQTISLWLPGGCALIAARFAAVIATSTAGPRLACHVGGADSGIWGLQGLPGRGSALPLETLTVADGGDLAHTALAGDATAVFSAATGLTTITSTGGGDAVGFSDSAITATDFEVTVLGGADDAAGGDATTGELAAKAVYPVVASTSANAFTVTGDTGDCDLTITITKKGAEILAYLDEGPESGMLEILTPQDAVVVQNMVGGVTVLCGGYTMAADSTATLADGIVEGQYKGFAGLGTLTTKGWKVTVSSGLQEDHSTALATCLFDAAAETLVVQWHGNLADGTGGLWHELHNVGATIA